MKFLNFAHLKENDATYFQHLHQALFISFYMLYGSIACFVHAFFPFIFWKSASAAIRKILKDIPRLL